jgi:Zn-dependent peptidase ImmA (M78 family)/DNA-binding XRE family transcriptional regulator
VRGGIIALMGKRVEALVKPELLLWARKSAGLSQEIAAKKAQVSLDSLISWENGDARPTIPQLIKLGNVYKRPISVFYLPHPPKQFDALHDYRRLPGQPVPSLSPALTYEIRKARERRQIALDLYELLGDQPPKIALKISLNDNPEELTKGIREFLKIDIETQTSWKTIYEAYNAWRRTLEIAGILSFQNTDSKIKLEEMRGFSISEMPLPVIVINKEDFPAPRIFSLIHELAHVLLREEGICEFDKVDFIAPDEQKIEIFCNHVAGAVLVPKATFLSEVVVRHSHRVNSIEDDKIRALATGYKVSREVVLRRLLQFGHISSDFYKYKKELYEEEAKKKAKEDALRFAKAEKQFFVPVYMQALRSNGRNFTNLILTSYYQDKITLSDVSDYLGVKLKHLPKIEQEMSKSFSYG